MIGFVRNMTDGKGFVYDFSAVSNSHIGDVVGFVGRWYFGGSDEHEGTRIDKGNVGPMCGFLRAPGVHFVPFCSLGRSIGGRVQPRFYNEVTGLFGDNDTVATWAVKRKFSREGGEPIFLRASSIAPPNPSVDMPNGILNITSRSYRSILDVAWQVGLSGELLSKLGRDRAYEKWSPDNASEWARLTE